MKKKRGRKAKVDKQNYWKGSTQLSMKNIEKAVWIKEGESPIASNGNQVVDFID